MRFKGGLFLVFSLLLVVLLSVQFVSANLNTTVTIVTPASNANLSGTVNFNATIPSIESANNLSFYIFNLSGSGNWTQLCTNLSSGFMFNCTFNTNNASITDGAWTINATARNSTNTTYSSNVSVTIDNTPAVIALPFYTNGTLKKASDTLTLNISATDVTTMPSACKIDINGTNQTVAVSSGWCNITNGFLTGLSDGNRTIKVYVNDSANNSGFNNSYVVTIDGTAPVVTMPFYTNITNKSASQTLTLNISVTDVTTAVSACKVDINGTNQTYSVSNGWCNITDGSVIGLSDGNNVIKVYANDSLNNLGFNNSYVVRVDNVAPVIKLPFYTNGTVKQSTQTLKLNISATDATTAPSACTVNINGTNQTFAVSSGWCNITTGFLTNIPEGNKTINVYVNDSVNNFTVNDSYVVTIDDPGSVVVLPFYTNGTIKRNNQTLTLNVSATDATTLSSACKMDINGTNQTYDVVNGTCNITDGFLSNLPEGNNTLKIYANDSSGVFGWNDSYVIFMDSVGPTVSLASLSETTSSITLSISASDTGTGVSECTSNRGSVSGTTSLTDTGLSCSRTYTYIVTCVDNAGMSTAESKDFSTASCGGGGSSGSSGSSSNLWSGGTFSLTKKQFDDGYSKDMTAKQRLKVKVSNVDHYVGVKGVSSTSALIEVSSTPQEKTLSVGDEWKVELTGDNYYDLDVKVNSIQNNKANVLIKSIYEAVPAVAQQQPSGNEVAQDTKTQAQTTGNVTQGQVSKGTDLMWVWIVLVILIIAFIVWLAMSKRHKKRKYNGY